ncbi:MAG: hypothetical protein AB7E21_02075 [Pseudodonghicola sp.]
MLLLLLLKQLLLLLLLALLVLVHFVDDDPAQDRPPIREVASFAWARPALTTIVLATTIDAQRLRFNISNPHSNGRTARLSFRRQTPNERDPSKCAQ